MIWVYAIAKGIIQGLVSGAFVVLIVRLVDAYRDRRKESRFPAISPGDRATRYLRARLPQNATLNLIPPMGEAFAWTVRNCQGTGLVYFEPDDKARRLRIDADWVDLSDRNFYDRIDQALSGIGITTKLTIADGIAHYLNQKLSTVLHCTVTSHLLSSGELIEFASITHPASRRSNNEIIDICIERGSTARIFTHYALNRFGRPVKVRNPAWSSDIELVDPDLIPWLEHRLHEAGIALQ